MGSYIEEHEEELIAKYAKEDNTTPEEWKHRAVLYVIRRRYREKDAEELFQAVIRHY